MGIKYDHTLHIGSAGTITLYYAETDKAKHFSRSFVSVVLGRHLNINGACLTINRNQYGKPYLRDFPGVHYNVSHTKGIIVCAIAGRPIGVDVERIRWFDPLVVKRFFAENEKEYVFSSIEGQKERFAEIWTQKEAYVKWLGKGMTVAFNSFDVFNLDARVELLTFWLANYCLSLCREG